MNVILGSKRPRLSKSKVVLGLQCPKALYLSVHQANLADDISDSQQMIFDQGHEVGILAQKYYPGGVLIDAPYKDSPLALMQTQDAIAAGTNTIYEATFIHGDVLVKIDILNRKSPKHAWEIVEVKSSTQVKDVHIPDAAVQAWVVRGAGFKLKSVSIMTINNQCTYPDLSDLFNVTDVTKEVDAYRSDIPPIVAKFKKLLGSTKSPKVDIGPHCDDPYSCGFKTHCWSACKISDVSIFDIPRLSTDAKWESYRAGKIDLKSLDPDDFNATQSRMIECTVAKKRFVDSNAIAKALKAWKHPLSFLDFETIGYAIPRYNGQRPYQQLPFQFSCHIQKTSRGKLGHCEYLHSTDTDPREDISRTIVELVPESGSVVAYSMGFESGVLKTLADLFPKYRNGLLNIVDRLVDPLPIFRSSVYDPGFRGSFSIKQVAPAILGKSASYEEMDIGGGTEAQSAYMEMINPSTEKKRREELRRGLIEYCTKDTKGMVDLVSWLFEAAQGVKLKSGSKKNGK